MAKYIGKKLTQRNNIPFTKIPVVTVYGTVVKRYPEREYSDILDCVYEMADMVSNANGITVESAIEQVLHDEQWNILPVHKKLIAQLLKD